MIDADLRHDETRVSIANWMAVDLNDSAHGVLLV
jgi:hypothetical protein